MERARRGQSRRPGATTPGVSPPGGGDSPGFKARRGRAPLWFISHPLRFGADGFFSVVFFWM